LLKIQTFDLRKLIPNGVTFTILRDPLDVFESAYMYYNLTGLFGLDIKEFALRIAKEKTNKLPKNFEIVPRNFMLRDLGMTNAGIENLDSVHKKVQQLDKVMNNDCHLIKGS